MLAERPVQDGREVANAAEAPAADMLATLEGVARWRHGEALAAGMAGIAAELRALGADGRDIVGPPRSADHHFDLAHVRAVALLVRHEALDLAAPVAVAVPLEVRRVPEARRRQGAYVEELVAQVELRRDKGGRAACGEGEEVRR